MSALFLVPVHYVELTLLRLKCDEAPDEASTVSFEKILKIECNITINTNFMHTGIMDVGKRLTFKHRIQLNRLTGIRSKDREEFTVARPTSCIYTEIAIIAIAGKPDHSYGALCVEGGYWEES